jgi:hypothetical protein
VADILSISAHANYRSRFPRNSREANQEHLEWEDRVKPLRPYLTDLRDGLLCVAVLCVVCALLWRL